MKVVRTITEDKKRKNQIHPIERKSWKVAGKTKPKIQFKDAIDGSVLIHDKLDILRPKVHKDIKGLLDPTLVKDYKETCDGVYIKYTDKSSLEIKFGDNNKHHYKYIVNGNTVINDRA